MQGYDNSCTAIEWKFPHQILGENEDDRGILGERSICNDKGKGVCMDMTNTMM